MIRLGWIWILFNLALHFGLLGAVVPQVKIAAEQGDMSSQLKLAYALNAEGNHDEAVRWLEEAEKKGSVEAVRALGAIYSKKNEHQKAASYFAKAADRGDAAAQFLLATCFDGGKGVPQSSKEVIRWLKASAAGGNTMAQVRLGELYEKGVPDVLPKSPVDAFALYRKALDTAVGEVSNVVDPKVLLERLDQIRRSLPADDLKRAISRGAGFYSEKLPRWHGRTQFSGNGSGFFITTDGYLVSNHHVVAVGSAFLIKSAYGVHSATVVDVDVENDLALLKAEGKFFPVPVVNSDLPQNVEVGTKVFVYGYPSASLLGQEEPKYAAGSISAMEYVAGLGDKTRDFRITVPLIGGNSGGGLFNLKGNVIGVAVSGSDRQGYESDNQAVKSSRLLKFLETKHPTVRARLAPPVLWQRPDEEVAAEVRQGVVLIGTFFSAYDFAAYVLGDLKNQVLAALFKESLGGRQIENGALESEFKEFLRKTSKQRVSQAVGEVLERSLVNRDWTKREAREAVERLEREGKLQTPG